MPSTTSGRLRMYGNFSDQDQQHVACNHHGHQSLAIFQPLLFIYIQNVMRHVCFTFSTFFAQHINGGTSQFRITV